MIRRDSRCSSRCIYDGVVSDAPKHLDLDKQRGLTVRWADGREVFYPIAHLRRMSPSADQRELRKEQARNPLTVLPGSSAHAGPLTATGADLVGNYAIRITFSDGHDTGIYSWQYLREIEPQPGTPSGEATGRPSDEGQGERAGPYRV